MRFRMVLCILALSSLSSLGCHRSNGDDDVATTKKVTVDSNENGMIVGDFIVGSLAIQQLDASSDSRINGASLAVPPGALKENTKITMQEGQGLGEAVSALSLGVTATEASYTTMITSSVDMDVAVPMTLAIPIEKKIELTDDHTNLVIIYQVRNATEDKIKIGYVLRSQIMKIEDSKVFIQVTHFGNYQAWITEEMLNEAKEIESTLPIKSKLDETAEAPAAPTDFSGNAGNKKVMLSWSYSDSNIDHFLITHDHDGSITLAKDLRTYTWSGLTNGTSYIFTIYAVDAAGNQSLTGAKTGTITPAVGITFTSGTTITGNDSNSTMYFDTTDSHLVFLRNTGGYGEVVTYSLSNPMSPTSVGSLTLSSDQSTWYPGRVLVEKSTRNYAYIDGDGYVVVINITNPTAPTYVAKVATPGSGTPYSMAQCGNRLYVAADQYMAVYDISAPASPTLVASHNPSGSRMDHIGCRSATSISNTDYVYVGDYNLAGLRVYTLTLATNTLTARGTYSGTNLWGGFSAAPTDDILYMGWSDSDKLAIFDLSNMDSISSPTILDGKASSLSEDIIYEDFLFTAATNQIFVFDITSPASPVEVASYMVYDSDSIRGFTKFIDGSGNLYFYTSNNTTGVITPIRVNFGQ